MPHSRLEDLPSPTSRGWPSAEGGFRAAKWGDMEVCLTTVDGPLDCTENYKLGRLPGGVCPCTTSTCSRTHPLPVARQRHPRRGRLGG